MNEIKIKKGFEVISETAGSNNALSKSILEKACFAYNFCPIEKLKQFTIQFIKIMLASIIIYSLIMAIPTGIGIEKMEQGEMMVSIHERLLSASQVSFKSISILLVQGTAGMFLQMILLFFVIAVVAMPNLKSSTYRELTNEKAY